MEHQSWQLSRDSRSRGSRHDAPEVTQEEGPPEAHVLEGTHWEGHGAIRHIKEGYHPRVHCRRVDQPCCDTCRAVLGDSVEQQNDARRAPEHNHTMNPKRTVPPKCSSLEPTSSRNRLLGVAGSSLGKSVGVAVVPVARTLATLPLHEIQIRGTIGHGIEGQNNERRGDSQSRGWNLSFRRPAGCRERNQGARIRVARRYRAHRTPDRQELEQGNCTRTRGCQQRSFLVFARPRQILHPVYDCRHTRHLFLPYLSTRHLM